VVLGADTIVVRDLDVLGKPRDDKDAVEMLLSLAGREHQVMTGVWVCSPQKCDGFTDVATVRFFPFTREEAEEYVRTGEPKDKAGSYGIQGLGMRFVEGINGDFYTVMGLPGGRLRRFLLEFPDFLG
jgi:septum formation protein